jgi:hypothetical protein
MRWNRINEVKILYKKVQDQKLRTEAEKYRRLDEVLQGGEGPHRALEPTTKKKTT